ncbi:MAG: methyltransferase domain-containing protein [Verrucomicrobiota bacterium]
MDFSRRAIELRERMDDPEADETLLFNTFAQFDRVNRMFANWSGVFKRHMLPIMRTTSGPFRVLDVGGGGGDIMRHLHQLARDQGVQLEGKIIDPDERAMRFHLRQGPASSVYEPVYLQTIADRGETYDFILCNHLLHHLDDSELTSLCTLAAQVATHKVIFNDIQRSRLAYHLFKASVPLLFRDSFIVEDGGISIRRSFTARELRQALPANWRVETLAPFRLLAVYEH